MNTNKSKDAGIVTVRLTKEQSDYIDKRVRQGYTKSGYIGMLIDEAMLRDGQAHSSIVETLTNITNKCQKMKRKTEQGNKLGVSEIQDLERQTERLWEKL